MIFLLTSYIAITLIVVIFQISLLFGAPLGEYTMGGKYKGSLPKKIRVAVFLQILVLFFFLFIVLINTGFAFSQYASIGNTGIWFVVAFFVLGSILNLATPSKKERMVWGPVNVLTLLIVLLIALN
ncbi:MAG: hypothetical protein ACK4ND_05400 [Cytophagaceae bacterium]